MLKIQDGFTNIYNIIQNIYIKKCAFYNQNIFISTYVFYFQKQNKNDSLKSQTMISNSQNDITVTTTTPMATSSPTTNITAAEETSSFEFSNTTIITIQSLILCFALLGNLILIVSISKTKRMRKSTTHKLVLNLAVCDIIIVTSSIINHNVELATGRFVFDEFGCRIIYPVSTYGVIAAVLSLLLICVDRFVATSYPFRHRWLKTKTKYAIALVHVLSVACVIPYSLHLTLTGTTSEATVNNASILTPNVRSNFTQTTSIKNTYIIATTKNESSLQENVELPQYCTETWSPYPGFVYTIFLFVIQYAAPLIIIIILYSITWTTIKNKNADVIQKAEKRFRDSTILTNPSDFQVTEHGGSGIPECFPIPNTKTEHSESDESLTIDNRICSNSPCLETSKSNKNTQQRQQISSHGRVATRLRSSSASSLNTVTITNHSRQSEISINDVTTHHNQNNKKVKRNSSNISCTTEFSTIDDPQHNGEHKSKNNDETFTQHKNQQPLNNGVRSNLSSTNMLSASTTSLNDGTHHHDRKPRSRSLLGSFRNSTISLFTSSDEADHHTRYNSQIAIERHKQTVKLLKLFISVVLVFAICMLPNQLTWLYFAFKKHAGESGDLGTIPVTVAYWLTYTNSVVNPIIYGTHSKFRRLYTNSVKELVNFLCTRVACMKRPVCETSKPIGRPVSALISTSGSSFHAWTPENAQKRFSRTKTSITKYRTSTKSQNCYDDNNYKNDIHNGAGSLQQLQIPVIKFTVADDEEFSFHGDDYGSNDDVFNNHDDSNTTTTTDNKISNTVNCSSTLFESDEQISLPSQSNETDNKETKKELIKVSTPSFSNEGEESYKA